MRALRWALWIMAVVLLVLAVICFQLDGEGWGYVAVLFAVLCGIGSDLVREEG